MKLDVHWMIKNFGHKPNEKSVVLSVEEIVELAAKMQDDDVIYTYHTEKKLDRIALFGTNSDEIIVSIQGHGGCFDKTYCLCDLKVILENFEKIQLKCIEYGFKPDWE